MTIRIVGVTKYFGKQKVLDNVTFEVNNGEIVGYVGLNGAGKTTTIRIAVGVLPPDSGDVLIDGYSVTKKKREASLRVGWVPELPIFEQEFKALDYFAYLAGYYGFSVSEARRLGRELLEKFGLGDAMNKKLSEYSQGMKKRFALAVSMINDPPNFLFDEVLNGLDPKGIAFFRELAKEFRRQGKAVLFSSHILSEVEDIADRVVFIHKGRIIGVFRMDEIKSAAKPAIELELSIINEKVLSILEKLGKPVVSDGNKVVLGEPLVDASDVVIELSKAGVKVHSIKKVEKSLEEFFFSLVTRADRGEI